MKIAPCAFPYSPRKFQRDIMEAIGTTFSKRGHMVLESGTGTGKTIVALAPAVEYARKNGKKVLYLTRTNSQQRQVIVELRALAKELKKNGEKLFGMGLQGRQNMCPLVKKDEQFASCNAEELARMCQFRKKETHALVAKGVTKFPGDEKHACPYFFKFMLSNASESVVADIVSWAKDNLPLAEEVNAKCESCGVCPYETNKVLIRDARVVAAPYIYLLHPGIMHRTLDWLGVPMRNLIVIVDEAHNLPEYARQTRSIELSSRALAIAISEAQEYNNPEVIEGVRIDDFLGALLEILYKFSDEYVIDEDGLVPPSELEAHLMGHFKITSRKLSSAVKDIVTVGSIIQDMKARELKLPRSYVHSAGTFLQFWLSLEAENYVKLVKNDASYSAKEKSEKTRTENKPLEAYDDEFGVMLAPTCECEFDNGNSKINIETNPKLEAYCLDPSVATSVMLDAHATLHMSGTLAPLEEYRDSIGLPKESRLDIFPSPFPKENRLVVYTPDVTTKYDDIVKDYALVGKMEGYVEAICNKFKRNTAVFFPSFALMKRFIDDGVVGRINREVFLETQGLKQSELMEIVNRFKVAGNAGSAVLFSVIGGRVSEGIDFPDKELEIAILVGIPYPKPTSKQKALQYYYDLKFGKGWEYIVKAPTTRRLLQTIGRLIRNETDRGVAVVLDRRIVQFEAWLQYKETNEPLNEITTFFGKRI